MIGLILAQNVVLIRCENLCDEILIFKQSLDTEKIDKQTICYQDKTKVKVQ